jgi:hypothetical protein
VAWRATRTIDETRLVDRDLTAGLVTPVTFPWGAKTIQAPETECALVTWACERVNAAAPPAAWRCRPILSGRIWS